MSIFYVLGKQSVITLAELEMRCQNLNLLGKQSELTLIESRLMSLSTNKILASYLGKINFT